MVVLLLPSYGVKREVNAMTRNSFVGSRWWKFDFHTHTPASGDFNQPDMSARDWLLAHMQRQIDCVAITDHNSGSWIEKLQSELFNLEIERPSAYRPLHLFPGVEISVQGGVHLLAIFDCSKTTSDIDSLLGAIGYRGQKGRTDDGETEKSFQEVVEEIDRHGGLAVPAHADKAKGIFRVQG